ncbi:MAG: hypothetical protein A2202_02690 [Bdellovibrionales bacterium RIFOXYA1_FULL_36_14]|nr:MAG: hypothetical protein A2202_02690 [Bdellovibrionales bacterium RIFOXYA1_FULL_36_14]
MKLDDLINKYFLEEDEQEKIRLFQDLKNNLGYDDLNTDYFLALAFKYKNAGQDKKQIFIYQDELPSSITANASIAWPTAILDESMLKYLPHTSYKEILAKYEGKKCEDVVLWIKKMQAGTGTSIERRRYLSNLFKKEFGQVVIGAKGTDLYVEIKPDVMVSIVELQLLQAIKLAESKMFAGVILQDIVSKETERSLDEIWNKKSALHGGRKYLDIIHNTEGLGVVEKIFQHMIPTIDEDGCFSFNRMAPAGHGLFGIEALKAAIVPKHRPDITKKILISSIGNGEDLGSSPDEVMVAWMSKENIPIAMVTTTKTKNDLKGGQISILKEDDKYFATIIEKAQAEQSNQLELFYELGLRENDKDAFFNTNMVLINYNVLIPIIETIVFEIGIKEFFREITPDLIVNGKKQVDPDGVVRKYFQIEGALGSVILNLDKFYRKKYQKPLVHFLNVETEYRDRFFSPIKNSFDFMMQFYSDRFYLDKENFKLINQSEDIPMVDLKDDYYQDVYNTLSDFAYVSIMQLEQLEVEGKVNFAHLTLQGQVKVINHSGKYFNLTAFLKANNQKLILDNVEVFIDADGKCQINPITAPIENK